MKVLLLFFLVLSVLGALAQRRPLRTEPTDTEASSQRPITRSRGRARFTHTHEFEQLNNDYEAVTQTRRRKPETPKPIEKRPQRPNKPPKTYEVKEVVLDDTPNENHRKLNKKPRVITESRFEAGKKDISPIEDLPPNLSAFVTPAAPESLAEETILTTLSDNAISSTEKIMDPMMEEAAEMKRKESEAPPASSTTKTPEGRRPLNSRINFRPRETHRNVEEEIPTASRSRGRPSGKGEELPSGRVTPPTRSNLRTNRRRVEPTQESPRTRGPSVLNSENAHEGPTRARTGRRASSSRPNSREFEESFKTNTRNRLTATPEKNEVLPRRGGRFTDVPTEAPKRKHVTRATSTEAPNQSFERQFKGRTRSRSFLTLNEQKLEVLPLFENEPRTVLPTDYVTTSTTTSSIDPSLNRRRTLNGGKINVKSIPSPTKVSTEQSVSIETKSEKAVRKVYKKRPSLLQQNKITRKPTVVKSNEEKEMPEKGVVEEVKVAVRQMGRKLPSKKNDDLTKSEEAIDEADNYPAPYKAALQAKKNKQGSRSKPSQENDSLTKTVTSSQGLSTSSSEIEVKNNLKKNEDDSAPKELRPRIALTTRHPRSQEGRSLETLNRNRVRKYKQKSPSTSTEIHVEISEEVASSTSTSVPSHKFHARFKSTRNATRTGVKPRNYSPKPPKGLYSSRKGALKNSTVVENAEKAKVVPLNQHVKPNSRFSSRYRNDILSKSATHRTSTTMPPYVPTVPTVTPPPAPSSVKIEDLGMGMEVISFDDPVANTVPSANLISGDYLSSSTDKSETNSLSGTKEEVRTTERPVSIIERIINSITAISTTNTPEFKDKTTSTQRQTTPSSAILNLVSKRPKEVTLDPIQQKQTLISNNFDFRTTEKPTTVIERILSSLSAIRADTSSESATVDPLQVGSSFNTVDSNVRFSPTESLSRIAKSTIVPRDVANTLPLVRDSSLPPSSTASSLSTSTTGGTGSTLVTSDSGTTRLPLTARTSTTLDPTNSFFEEIASEQTLPKRTIDKLLSLLNVPSPTTTPLVIVTPKLTTFVTDNTDTNATPSPSTEPPTTTKMSAQFTSELESLVNEVSGSPNPLSVESTTPTVFRSELEALANSLNQNNPLIDIDPTLSSRLKELLSTLSRMLSTTSSTPNTETTTPQTSTNTPEITSTTTTTTTTSTSQPILVASIPSSSPSLTTTPSSVPTILPIPTVPIDLSTFVENLTTSTDFSVVQSSQTQTTMITSTTPSTPTGTIPQQTETMSESTTTKPTQQTTEASSTLPTLANFEVSPDSVSILSANDISSTFIPDDIGTTISILARSFGPEITNSTSSVVTTTSVVATTTDPPNSSTSSSTPQITSSTPQTTSSVPETTSSTPETLTTTSSTLETTTTTSSTTQSLPSTSTTLSSMLTSTLTTANTEQIPTTMNNTVDTTTQDVSSNTIDTNSVTDKQGVLNITDASNFVNPLSATGTNNITVSTRNGTVMMEVMGRDGRLLRFEASPIKNDISDSEETRTKDYYIFAVLQNNTILRKRPSRFPNKDTPFLIYGVLPNNTVVMKFPNGTIVPMEPVIQVVGFDTRDNPPPPPELISNQVQDNQPESNKVSTADVSQNTVISVEPNRLSLNGLSSTTSSTMLPPLTEILGGKTVSAFNSIVNQTNGGDRAPRVQTLEVDPLVDARVKVENLESNTIGSSSSEQMSTPSPAPAPPTTALPLTTTTTTVPTTTTATTTTTTAAPTTTRAPTTTQAPTTTTKASTTPTTTTTTTTTQTPTTTTQASTITQATTTNTQAPTTTTTTTTTPQPFTSPLPPSSKLPSSSPTLSSVSPSGRALSTTTQATTAPYPPPIPIARKEEIPTTTFFPVFKSTLTTISAPDKITIITPEPPKATSLNPNALSAQNGAQETTTKIVPTTPTLPISSSTIASSAVISSTIASLKNLNLRQKQLTEQQKKDLAILESLEKEQEAILQQLAFLTGLNLKTTPDTSKGNLAERVLQQAMQKLQDPVSTQPSLGLLQSLSPKNSRASKNLQAPSVEDIVKQINANGLQKVTPPGPIVTSTYGKSSDALLASLLKEYGVGPSTPEALSNAFTTTTSTPKPTTRRRITTTQAPGGFFQGLSWLFNTLAPQAKPKPKATVPTTSRPTPKPTTRAVTIEEELLSKQPTELTPVIALADEPKAVLTQAQILALIKQLEEVQQDPRKAKNIDINALKSLPGVLSLATNPMGIQVISQSQTGATPRSFTSTQGPRVSSSTNALEEEVEIRPLVFNRGTFSQSTTPLTLSVSNSLLDDVPPSSQSKSTLSPVDFSEVPEIGADIEAATTKSRIPPVKLNPVPGIPDENPRIRGQLVNYAINVTKAISSFLGSALQGAATSFQSMIGNGLRTVANLRGNADNQNRPG